MPHPHHAVFESVLVSALLIAAGVAYVRGSLRLCRPDFWKSGSFLLGLFFIWLAVASPIAALDHQLLTAHMVQHLLLMSLASPLIWLAAPVKPLLRGLPEQFVQSVVTPLSRSVPIQMIGRALTHPAVCWVGATAALIGWHVPAIFALGMRWEIWHGIEQTSFLAAGLLFWWPVIQPWQRSPKPSEWSIVLYLFLATLPCDILSGFLVFCDRVVYPGYFSISQPFGLSALEDQQCAGALMWTVVTVVFLIAGTIFTARLLSPQMSREHALLQPRLYGGPVLPAVRQGTEAR